MARFKSEDRTLEFLFDRAAFAKIFSIKPPQRKYRWQKAQLDDLWDDVLKAKQHGSPFHYLGPITLTPTPEQEDSVNVIDGQQRLATVSMLLASLRNEISSILELIQNPDIRSRADGFRTTLDRMVSRIDMFGNRIATIINLLPADHHSYNSYAVLHPGDSGFLYPNESQPLFTAKGPNRIQYAMRFLQGKVSTYESQGGPDSHADELMQLGAFYIDKVLLVVIETPSESEFAVVFDSSNSRGLGLTSSERLKSVLLAQTERENPIQSAEVLSQWDNMAIDLERVSEKEVDSFLRVCYLSNYNHVSKVGLYEAWKTLAESTGANLVPLVHSINVHSKNYMRLVAPTVNDEHYETLTDLANMKVVAPLPLLLAVSEATPTSFADALAVIVRLQIRNLIIGNHQANEYEKKWSEWSTEIRSGHWTNVRSEIISNIDSDDEFERNFAAKEIKDSRTVLYILKRLEFHGIVDRLPPATIDVEHVLSTSVAKRWMEGNSDELTDAWAADMGHEPPVSESVTEDLAKYLDRLGNKTLWHKKPNRSEQNSPFSKKKLRYANTQENTMVMTRDLANYSSWSLDVIKQRQIQMAEKALSVWEMPL